jgi:hypothetical protein
LFPESRIDLVSLEPGTKLTVYKIIQSAGYMKLKNLLFPGVYKYFMTRNLVPAPHFPREQVVIKIFTQGHFLYLFSSLRTLSSQHLTKHKIKHLAGE